MKNHFLKLGLKNASVWKAIDTCGMFPLLYITCWKTGCCLCGLRNIHFVEGVMLCHLKMDPNMYIFQGKHCGKIKIAELNWHIVMSVFPVSLSFDLNSFNEV